MDLMMHFFVGFVSFFLLSLIFKPTPIVFVLIVFEAIGKEIFDIWYGTPSIEDVVFTVLGAMLALFLLGSNKEDIS